jgi:hypothetical protein
MNEKLRVAFDQPADGWLQLEIHATESAFRDTFSHIYSSLPDLCEALCDVLVGDIQPRRVVFLLEPAEVELRFAPHDGRCRVSLKLFAGRRRDIDGRAVFEFDGATADIVLPFWRALRRLQTILPEDEFEKVWREPFPRHEMQVLTDLLDKHRMIQRSVETTEAG